MRNFAATIRRFLKLCWICFLYVTGAIFLAKRQMGARGAVVVLTFHRVLPQAQHTATLSLPGMVIGEKTFEEMAQYVAQRYEVVSVSSLCSPSEPPSRKPRLAFTFDDGWQDNARVAHPIARCHGIPLTIFLCPGKSGSTVPFWPEQVAGFCRTVSESRSSMEKLCELAPLSHLDVRFLTHSDTRILIERIVELLKSYPAQDRDIVLRLMAKAAGGRIGGLAETDSTMGWFDIRELSRDNVTFGSHTYSHEILTRVSREKAEQELSSSKRAIESELQRECSTFAYPNGNESLEIRQLVAKAGYKAAFTTRVGYCTSETDPFSLPRINVWEGKVSGISGRFSRIMFEYSIFWKAYRGEQAHRRTSGIRRLTSRQAGHGS